MKKVLDYFNILCYIILVNKISYASNQKATDLDGSEEGKMEKNKTWNFGNLWSYEVRKKLLENNAKIGDTVKNVGYFKDNDKNNYKSAIIKKINNINIEYIYIENEDQALF